MSSALQVLADPTRLRIVEALRRGECSVNDIVNVVGIHQSGVSRHLRILLEAGFVVVRGEAQERIYSLRVEPFLELDTWLSEYRNPKRSEVEGELLHAKHALQPNSLGYCGPDENETILEHLYESTTSERLTSILTRFESAHPFVRMIAKSTGRQPFDREVTEAYWIGNHLLDNIKPSDFYQFTNQDLNPSRNRVARMDGIGGEDARFLFRELGPLAKPHHTFYVLGMYARSSVKSGSENKLLRLMDSCRISWGEVVEVKKDALTVGRPTLAMSQDRLSLTLPQKEEVHYDPRIPSFSDIRRGDWVSVHWNFACERLTSYQLRNLKFYTDQDIDATNRLRDLQKKEGRLER